MRPVPSDAPLPDGYLAFDGRPFRLRMGLKPLGPETWIELEVQNHGASTLWVSLDGVTVTGPDGHEHRDRLHRAVAGHAAA